MAALPLQTAGAESAGAILEVSEGVPGGDALAVSLFHADIPRCGATPDGVPVRPLQAFAFYPGLFAFGHAVAAYHARAGPQMVSLVTRGRYPRTALANALKMCASRVDGRSSGCHCTATRKRLSGSSIASTMPSGARAVTFSPAPIRSTAW